jgi:hypothetical protein
MIYAISAAKISAYPVKIGFTDKSVKSRLESLQTGNPYKLVVLFEFNGTYALERAIHRRLACHRANGEWFHRSSYVTDTLTTLRDSGLIWEGEGFADASLTQIFRRRPVLLAA